MRKDCKEFAQNNPPEWFINAIANSHDNNGMVRSETKDYYAINILNSNRWGDPEVEGRILCGKYGLTLHLIESNPLQAIDNQQKQFLHQLVSSTGSINAGKYNKVDYNDDRVIHIVNKGAEHFEPVLDKAKIRSVVQQENQQSSSDNLQQLGSSRHASSDFSDYDQIRNQDELNADLMTTIRGNDSEEEKVKKIKDLLNDGADVNFKDANRENNTPLHAAVRKGELKVVKLLVEKRANVNNKNTKNKTPQRLQQILY